MAADTRENSAQQDSSADSSQSLTVQDKNYGERPENADLLPGKAVNTAGGKIRDTTLIDAVKTIRLKDFKDVHKKPCARDAFLAGFSAGFGVGGIRAIIGTSTLKACSWAVGTFCFGSFLMHEFCQRKRHLEKKSMKRAVEVIDRKRAKKQAMVDQAELARPKPKAEDDVRGH